MPHLTIQATPNVTIPHAESLLKTLNNALWGQGILNKRRILRRVFYQ